MYNPIVDLLKQFNVNSILTLKVFRKIMLIKLDHPNLKFYLRHCLSHNKTLICTVASYSVHHDHVNSFFEVVCAIL